MTTIEPRDMDSLLGAYVLDALEADERAQVELHLEQDARARREVDELRETVAALAIAPGIDEPAPQELWDRIAAQIEDETPADELAARRARKASRPVVWVTSAVAAVAAIAVIVLALQVVSLNNDLDKERQPSAARITAEYDRAAQTEGARTATLASDRGTARVVLLPDGTGFIVNDGLPPVDGAQTYQLWAFTGNGAEPTIVSAAVLGPDADSASFKIAGPVQSFAMTVEGAGGAAQPTQAPFTTGNLS
jgi:anti-sigma-K factor RskA